VRSIFKESVLFNVSQTLGATLDFLPHVFRRNSQADEIADEAMDRQLDL